MKLTKEILSSVAFIGLIYLITLIVNCGPKQADEVIIGAVDWKPVSGLNKESAIYKNSTGVGFVRIGTSSRCTGFKVAKNAFLTNWHCAKDSKGKVTKQSAQNLAISFDYTDGPGVKYYRGFDVLKWNRTLDYALIQVNEDLPGKTLNLETKDAPKDEPGYIINQNCDYFSGQCLPIKQYDDTCKFRTQDATNFRHDCDTLGGSSGSPFFSKITNKVVGIHFAGHATSKNGRGVANFAKQMADIYPEIEKFLDKSHNDPIIDPTQNSNQHFKYLYPSKFECTMTEKFGEIKCKMNGWKLKNQTNQ